MVNKTWRIIPRPLLETILNNHAQHHRVPQPLILHGPRGVGKTTLILERLLEKWNTGPHLTGYVDFAQPIESHHPSHGHSFPWTSWSNCPPPPLPALQIQLERCLESMAQTGVKLGTITSHQIFITLNKWHGLNATLSRILQSNSKSSRAALSDKVSNSVLWGRAVWAASARLNADEVDGIVKGGNVSMEEVAYFKEAMAGLSVAKEVIRVQQGWRRNAVRDLNRVGGFSRSLANSATDWPCLLLELLSSGAEIDYFQVNAQSGNFLRNCYRFGQY